MDAMQGSPTGANIITLYNGTAVSPNGLFHGLIDNGTIVAADLKGPLTGKVRMCFSCSLLSSHCQAATVCLALSWLPGCQDQSLGKGLPHKTLLHGCFEGSTPGACLCHCCNHLWQHTSLCHCSNHP